MTLAADEAAIAAAQRIREKAGARVHRLGEPDELTEEAMPKGVYERKKAEAPTTITDKAPAPTKKKPGRRPGVKAAKTPTKRSNGKPRFGVFDDGSITIILPQFKGSMSPEEARQFVGFLGKIGVKV